MRLLSKVIHSTSLSPGPSIAPTSSAKMAARQASKLFYAYLPDANNVLAKRYEVRPMHLKRAEEDKKAGTLGAYRSLYLTLSFPLGEDISIQRTPAKDKEADSQLLEFGRGYLPSANSPLWTSPELPAGAKPIAGSLMIFRMNTIDEVWERIKDDVYWTEGIWDKEKGDVKEFI